MRTFLKVVTFQKYWICVKLNNNFGDETLNHVLRASVC